MAEVLIRAFETSTTVGTGTYALDGAPYGFQTFVGAGGATKQVYYLAEDVDIAAQTGKWEFGIGTVTDSAPDTLTRDTVLASSEGGSAVNWPAGTRNVVSCVPASGFMIGANNLSELTNLATARSNLGLGDAAVMDQGAGNGLDADTVDTVQAADIVQLTGNFTITGANTHSGNNTFSGDNSFSGKNNFDAAAASRLRLPVGADKWAT